MKEISKILEICIFPILMKHFFFTLGKNLKIIDSQKSRQKNLRITSALEHIVSLSVH